MYVMRDYIVRITLMYFILDRIEEFYQYFEGFYYTR